MAKILGLAKAGDSLAQTKLYDHLAPRIISHLLYVCGCPTREDAEDICQDLLAKAFARLDEFEALPNLEAWCLRSAQVLNALRARREAAAPPRAPFWAIKYAKCPHDDPAQELAAEELIAKARRFASELPPEQSRVALAMLDGDSVPTVATRLSMSEEVVRKHWRVARESLRRILGRTRDDFFAT